MSLYQRGNVYWTKFGIKGELFRQSLKTSDPEKAKRKEIQVIADAAQGKLRAWTDPFERLAFHCEDPDRLGALEIYLRDHKPALSPTTAMNEPYHARALAKFFGDRRVSNITESKIKEYISKRHDDGRANATINKELRILIGILKRAKRWHLFSDAIKSLRVRKSKVGRALELGEKLWLLRASQAKKGWCRARLATLLAINTTMRAGELRNLKWQDVDWLERTLHVRQGKTDESQREIWLNDVAWSAIAQLREEAKELFGENLLPEWFVFFSWPANCEPDPTRPATTWRTAWRSMTRSIVCPKCTLFQDPGERCANEKCAADIRKVQSPIARLRFHDLRHHAITELSEGGASDETIMSIAGHIDRRMMSHYSHIRKQARRAALEQLGKKEGASEAQGTIRAQLHQDWCNAIGVPLSQLIEKNGGDDETRTRDLCRDRAAF